MKAALLIFILLYFTGIAQASAEKDIATDNIRAVLDQIFISKENNTLKISETVIFRNEGTEIFYSKDNHTFFALSIPVDAKNLKAQAMECCLVQEKGIVYIDPMQTIKPGDNFEMQVSYIIQSSEYVFNKSAVYNTSSLSIFFDKKEVSFEGASETVTLHGNEYSVVTFEGLKAGETTSIAVKIIEKSNYLYAVIGLLSLFSMGSFYALRGKLLRKKQTLEELEFEKRKIFQTIHGFEKHAGNQSSEEYRKLMEEYKQKVIQIFIKMDKIKSKDKPSLLKMNDNADLTKI